MKGGKGLWSVDSSNRYRSTDMLSDRLAMRYAKGLLTYSQERDELKTIVREVQALKEQVEQSRDLRIFLRSPVINGQAKGRLVTEIMRGYSTTMINFVQLMVQQRREMYLYDTTKAFIQLYDAAKDIRVAYVTTVIPLDDTLRRAVLSRIGEAADEVVLEERIDPDIIGGFVIRLGDWQFDHSVAGKLKSLQRDFRESACTSEILNG